MLRYGGNVGVSSDHGALRAHQGPGYAGDSQDIVARAGNERKQRLVQRASESEPTG